MNLDDFSDHRLMELIKAGQEEAFVAIVHRHQQSLLNFFCRMGAYIDDVEDLVQETFLRLFNFRLKYEPSAKFTTYLYLLARHVWVDNLRKLKRRVVTGVQIDSSSAGDKYVLQTDMKIDLQTALDQLSEKLRLVVILNIY